VKGPNVQIKHEGGEVTLWISGVDPLGPAATAVFAELAAKVQARTAKLSEIPEVQLARRLEDERDRARDGISALRLSIETMKGELADALGDDARVALISSRISKAESDAKALALLTEVIDARLPAAEGERGTALSEALKALVGDERRIVAAEIATAAAAFWQAAAPIVARLEALAMLDRRLLSFAARDPLAVAAESRLQVEPTTQ